jgi:hypothetical protein
VVTLPMPWDSVYLDRWFAFQKLLSDRYGTSPAFRVIAADGPTSVSDEATLPRSPQALRAFQAHRYTPAKYIAAWRQTFRVFAADFPNQYVSLSVGFDDVILDINDQGRIDRTGLSGTRTRPEIQRRNCSPGTAICPPDERAPCGPGSLSSRPHFASSRSIYHWL